MTAAHVEKYKTQHQLREGVRHKVLYYCDRMCDSPVGEIYP